MFSSLARITELWCIDTDSFVASIMVFWISGNCRWVKNQWQLPLINLRSRKKSQNDVAIVSYLSCFKWRCASAGCETWGSYTCDINVPKTVNKIDFFMDLISITSHNTWMLVLSSSWKVTYFIASDKLAFANVSSASNAVSGFLKMRLFVIVNGSKSFDTSTPDWELLVIDATFFFVSLDLAVLESCEGSCN